MLRKEIGADADKLGTEIWTATQLLDKLGLYTTECFQAGREEMISRQQQELLELSTPVIQLADGILALPLIGTLDSARTQRPLAARLGHTPPPGPSGSKGSVCVGKRSYRCA